MIIVRNVVKEYASAKEIFHAKSNKCNNTLNHNDAEASIMGPASPNANTLSKNGYRALDGVSLDIAEGEFVAITGKSGSGKSTLLNVIGTLDSLTSGQVKIDDYDISALSGKKLANFRNKMIGFIFQNFYLEPGYSVFHNVEMPLVLAVRTDSKKNKPLVEAALHEVGLLEKINSKARNLSGGEQQRVAIARAIINDPKYIFADEPCGNLDTANSSRIMNILIRLNSLGKTVVMVTHDESDALKAKRIITLSDGRIKDESYT